MDIKVIKYNIQKHGTDVQKLLDKYLVPTYISRMGIKPEERELYAEIEDVLESQSAFNPKFEVGSTVAVDVKSGKIVGCCLCYLSTKQFFKNNFIDINKNVGSDNKYPECIRKYTRHRHVVCHDLIRLYDDYKIDELIYLESTVIHPKYRGAGLNNVLFKNVLMTLGGKYGILCEGMIPTVSQHPSGIVPGDVSESDGSVLVKSLYSYDGYAIPVWFIPPATTKHRKSKL